MTYVQWLYALDEKNIPVHISQAVKDRNIKYKCPDCESLMFPRRGPINRWHFAHFVANNNCSGEGYVHYSVKIFLSKYLRTLKNITESVPESKIIGTNYIADVMFKVADIKETFYIEIIYHHDMDIDKLRVVGANTASIHINKFSETLWLKAIDKFESGIDVKEELHNILDFISHYISLSKEKREELNINRIASIIHDREEKIKKAEFRKSHSRECPNCHRIFIARKSYYSYCTYICYKEACGGNITELQEMKREKWRSENLEHKEWNQKMQEASKKADGW